MKLTELELRKLIKKQLIEDLTIDVKGGLDTVKQYAEEAYQSFSSSQTKGAVIIAVTDVDVIGPEISKVAGRKIDLSLFPSGHAYGAVISPNGAMKAFTFGPPWCKDPKDAISKFLSKNPLPFVTSMTINTRDTKAAISKTGLTASQASAAAKKIRNAFGTNPLRYVAFNNIDSTKSLSLVPSHGSCRAYNIFPVGVPFAPEHLELDADNCATFAIDVLQAGSGLAMSSVLSLTELLTSPSMIVTALSPMGDFSGNV